jgi:hypothetical protein
VIWKFESGESWRVRLYAARKATCVSNESQASVFRAIEVNGEFKTCNCPITHDSNLYTLSSPRRLPIILQLLIKHEEERQKLASFKPSNKANSLC